MTPPAAHPPPPRRQWAGHPRSAVWDRSPRTREGKGHRNRAVTPVFPLCLEPARLFHWQREEPDTFRSRLTGRRTLGHRTARPSSRGPNDRTKRVLPQDALDEAHGKLFPPPHGTHGHGHRTPREHMSVLRSSFKGLSVLHLSSSQPGRSFFSHPAPSSAARDVSTSRAVFVSSVVSSIAWGRR